MKLRRHATYLNQKPGRCLNQTLPCPPPPASRPLPPCPSPPPRPAPPPQVRLATFSQHHVDGMDLALTPLAYMAKCFPDAKEEIHRGHLSSFGVPQDMAAQPMYTLSGGARA